MKFTMTKIAALVAIAATSTGANAVLTSANTLSIQADAITAQTSSSGWYVSSNGALLDSFFTINGSQVKQSLGNQYAFLYTGSNLTLDGTTQSNIASFSIYGASGNFKTLGTGVSILSASGDAATVNMSGWTADWSSVQNMTMGTLA